MNVDQRLHRAAHDLREVEIEVPPLDIGAGSGNTGLRRVGTPVATVMLFALGAIAVGSGIVPTSATGGQVALPAAVADLEPTGASTSGRDAPRQLSALEEVAMISSLGERVDSEPRSTVIEASIPPGAS